MAAGSVACHHLATSFRVVSAASKEDEAASTNPLIVMVDEESGDSYARAVAHKGLGTDGEQDWLIQDMDKEIKEWGHPGGEGAFAPSRPIWALPPR